MISETLIYDEEFNALSIGAQNIFLRMLTRADDCGVMPASESALPALINAPATLKHNLPIYLREIVTKKLGSLVEYNNKTFFIFKKESFLRIQSYIINKRKYSEYLKISAEEFDKIKWSSNEFQVPAVEGQLKANEGQMTKQENEVDMNLAKHLLRSIKQHSPKFKEPSLKAWAQVFSLMRQRDKRDVDEIMSVINWATSDEFWQGNILSAQKLRIQFDQLQIKMKAQRTTRKRTESEHRNCNRCGEQEKQDKDGKWYCPSCVAHASSSLRSSKPHVIGELLEKVIPKGQSK